MSTATDDLSDAVLALCEAVRQTAADPADAIRLLVALLLTPLPRPAQPDEQAAQDFTSAMFRGAALASIVSACADYQPASSTEANAMIGQVAGLLDTELTTAADAGQDASYAALRDLRFAVVADLRARSALLPELVTVAVPGNLPSLALAYRLYGDASREPGMVARANCIHPGYMPARFEALSRANSQGDFAA